MQKKKLFSQRKSYETKLLFALLSDNTDNIMLSIGVTNTFIIGVGITCLSVCHLTSTELEVACLELVAACVFPFPSLHPLEVSLLYTKLQVAFLAAHT